MSSPSFRFGETVTIRHRVKSGVDSYNNDVYTTTEEPISGCVISPGTSSQQFFGTVAIEADVIVDAPAGTTIDEPVDSMIVRETEYEVIGIPDRAESPFTGFRAPVRLYGRLVTSGGEAA